MHFERKPETCEQILNTKIPLLKSNSALDINPPAALNQSTPHLLIEGENLHVLMALQQTHKDAINLIYIDPPYNTGNKDFIYNDDFVDIEDGYRHSKWLSFMEKRLKLARELLTDTGAIFISIDENEQANLKLLCDQIFGENNHVASIHVELSTTQGMKVGAAQKGTIVKNAEYLLVYSKTAPWRLREPTYTEREFDSHYSYYWNSDTREYLSLKDKLISLGLIGPKHNLINAFNSDPIIRSWILENAQFIFQDGNSSFNKDDLDLHLVSDAYPFEFRGYFLIKTSSGKIRQLIPLDKSIGKCNDFGEKTGIRKIRGDWWAGYYKDMGNISKEGDTEFKNGKKPIRLLRDIIRGATGANAVVLDFFGGSGSTMHAVMSLNSQDGGSRQCILVTNNEGASDTEPGIFDSITYPRIKKVSMGYVSNKGGYVNGLNQTVRVFGVSEKLKSFIHKDYPIKGLIENSIETLLLKAGVYFSELCNHAFDFMDETSTIKIFKNSIASSSYVVIPSDDLSDHEIEKVINHIVEKHEDYRITVYKVKIEEDDNYLEETFKENSNIIFEDMPDIIRNAFKLANQAKKED